MKILIINTNDLAGGAARAAYRLHYSLIDLGIESLMLVQKKTGNDPTVLTSTSILNSFGKTREFIDAIPKRIYRHQTSTLFSPSWLPFGGIIKSIEKINPDIVHLHWICGGMIRIEDLRRIKKPIVWTLHDMWPFTGGCHYNEGCMRYISQCNFCPVLGSQKKNDLSSFCYFRKMRTYKKIQSLTIVGLSTWMTECALQSKLFGNNNIVTIPNPIDTSEFYPLNKFEARKRLKISSDKQIVLFGAIHATDDPRKGYRELIAALELVPKRDNLELFVFGGKSVGKSSTSGHIVNHLGYVQEKDLQVLYSASDVMVVPSLQENLSNTIMESLSCGTPVVAFDVGGNHDLIDHKQNGYLAKPFLIKDLAKGITYILDLSKSSFFYSDISKKNSEKFEKNIVAKKYAELYQSILFQTA